MDKVAIERDCGRIVSELCRMQPDSMGKGQIDGVLHVENIDICLSSLVTASLIYRNQDGEYKLTMDGVEYAQGIQQRAAIDSSSAEKFTYEALTGLYTRYCKRGNGLVSERSKIDRAVLPNGGAPRTNRTPEDELLDAESIRTGRERMAKMMGLDIGTLEKFMDEGRIKQCKHCCKIEVFDKKKGDTLQSACRKCRKKLANNPQ